MVKIQSANSVSWNYVNIVLWCCKVAQSSPESLQPHGLWPARLLCPWDSPARNTGVGCYFLLLGIFPTQGLKLGLLHCRQTLYRLTHQGSPVIYNINCILFFLATLCDLWDLSSLTRDWTWVLAVEVPSPNHWTAREFPTICFLIEPSKWCY